MQNHILKMEKLLKKIKEIFILIRFILILRNYLELILEYDYLKQKRLTFSIKYFFKW